MKTITASSWLELRERIAVEGLSGIFGVYRCKGGVHQITFLEAE